MRYRRDIVRFLTVLPCKEPLEWVSLGSMYKIVGFQGGSYRSINTYGDDDDGVEWEERLKSCDKLELGCSILSIYVHSCLLFKCEKSWNYERDLFLGTTGSTHFLVYSRHGQVVKYLYGTVALSLCRKFLWKQIYFLCSSTFLSFFLFPSIVMFGKRLWKRSWNWVSSTFHTCLYWQL